MFIINTPIGIVFCSTLNAYAGVQYGYGVPFPRKAKFTSPTFPQVEWSVSIS